MDRRSPTFGETSEAPGIHYFAWLRNWSVAVCRAGTAFGNTAIPKVGPMIAAFASGLGLTGLYGGIFKQPQPGSPAAHAGIEFGDVIAAINGSPLRNWSDFATTISMMAPGTIVYLTTYRDRQLIAVKVTLGYSRCHAPKNR